MEGIFDITTWNRTLRESWTEIAEGAGRFIPLLFHALVILLVGWVVSRLLGYLTRQGLRRLGLDRVAARTQLTEGLRRAGINRPPSAAVGTVVSWLVMLVFVLSAVETLGARAVTTSIDQLVAFFPRILAAVLIIVLGLLAGRVVRTLIGSGAAMVRLPRSDHVGALAQGGVVLIVCVVALEQLGIRTQVLVNAITALFVVIGITVGVTFAVGSSRIVTHILAGQYLRQRLPAGTEVEVVGRRGTVEHVGAVDTSFREGTERWSVPNAVLLEEVVNH